MPAAHTDREFERELRTPARALSRMGGRVEEMIAAAGALTERDAALAEQVIDADAR